MDAHTANLNRSLEKNFKKFSSAQAKDLYKMYDKLLRKYVSDIALAKNDSIAGALKAAMARELADEAKEIIEEYGIKLTQAQLKSMQMYTKAIYETAGERFPEQYKLEVDRIIGNSAKQNLELMERSNMYKDGVGLSERIWRMSNKAVDDTESAIRSMVASGRSARELAKDLKSFCLPSTRRELEAKYGPEVANKKIEYYGLRLARTTYTHLGQLAVKDYERVNPYADTVIWHSDCTSRSCELCISRNGKKFSNKNMPFDHPNGLCWQTVEFEKSMKDMAAELKDWANGGSNPRLDNWAKKMDPEGKVIKPPKPPKAPPKTPPKTPPKPPEPKKTTIPKPKPKPVEKAKPKKVDRQKIIEDIKKNNKNYTILADTDKVAAEQFAEMLSNAPQWYRDYMQKMSEESPVQFKTTNTRGGAAYYELGKGIAINFKWEREKGKTFSMDTLFHEYGHMMSDKAGRKYNKKLKLELPELSRDERWIAAIDKDIANIKKLVDDEGIQYLRDELRYKYNDENGKVCWNGASDVINGKLGYKLGWGHSDSYWAKNRHLPYEEAWASMSSSYVSPKAMECMSKYFPNAQKAYEEMINDIMKD